MREVTPETAADYLREKGRVPAGRNVNVRALGGGVSNVVMRVDVEGEDSFVLKQARQRLRTKAHWVSKLERIWTETAALELLASPLPYNQGLMPDGTAPWIVFTEPEDFLFAMTCAPDDSVVWKEQLLAGEADRGVAQSAGMLLGLMHSRSVGHPALSAGPLADLEVFDQLRIDPFYRTIARVHPDLAPRIGELIGLLLDPPLRTFVHADFSPKNILVHPGRPRSFDARGLTIVDFETAHAGDPAYDMGFILSHLLLKTVRAAPNDEPYLEVVSGLLAGYTMTAQLDGLESLLNRGFAHTAACALARIDGKSPVDYLDEPRREAVRRFARAALLEESLDQSRLLDLLAREMRLLNF